MSVTGAMLLHDVAVRILRSWMSAQGLRNVVATGGRNAFGGREVDITYDRDGVPCRVKVKPDPYFGSDVHKVADRRLTFYRADTRTFAFEAIASSATREPGWMSGSTADYLYYYFVAIDQPEDEVRALMSEPDEVLFSELKVERDELLVLPMKEARDWFEAHSADYISRPVTAGSVSAWYRLIPRAHAERALAGINNVGPVFHSLSS